MRFKVYTIEFFKHMKFALKFGGQISFWNETLKMCLPGTGRKEMTVVLCKESHKSKKDGQHNGQKIKDKKTTYKALIRKLKIEQHESH